MAKGLNKIQIIGNLGSDPDIKFTPGRSPFTNFSVAIKRGCKGPDSQMTEETDWFRVVCWNKLAEPRTSTSRKGHGSTWKSCCRSGSTSKNVKANREWSPEQEFFGDDLPF